MNPESVDMIGGYEIFDDREKEKKEYPYDGIIVFGHEFSDKKWKLSWEAWARAAAAYQLWKDQIAPVIILTGGSATKRQREKYGSELATNAELMREFLIKHFKVPPECLIIEDEPGSIKTVDNVGLALNALMKKGLAHERFITVSTGFHLDRIKKIMDRFGLESQPISAEQELDERAREHAEHMRQKEIESGLLSQEEIEKRFLRRKSRYDRAINRVKLKDPNFVKELENEPRWQEAMDHWGYWGPLALCVRGEKLEELVNNYREDITGWLERHPELGLTIDDLIFGNFDYRKVVELGREIPTQ